MRASKVASARSVVDRMALPPSAWKRVPGGRDEAVELGLRQWLACGIAAADRKAEIGLASAEIDLLWCGFIMSTARYGRFSRMTYSAFLHRRSRREVVSRTDGAPIEIVSTAVVGRALGALPPPGPAVAALANTEWAWEVVARPGETRLF